MSVFQLSSLRNNTIWGIFRVRHLIDMNPTYQREGGIWTPDKRKLLIDTVINRFDVPKIYLHKFPQPQTKDGNVVEYAVIDGKQRLETLWSFLEGRFALSSDFDYIHEDDVEAAGYTYADLSREYPDLKSDFDAFNLDIVCIETDDIELIEEMFSRLNEAVPLNAAEKRNARPGPLPAAVRGLAQHSFCREKLPFPNKRYRHYDLTSKMLMILSRPTVVDTKKAYLDRFFTDHETPNDPAIEPLRVQAVGILDAMAAIFVDKDPLLRSLGMVMLYFLIFRRASEQGQLDLITRPKLEAFETSRGTNRTLAETDIAQADYNLLEFDRYTQSPNDGIAMRFRLAVMDDKIFGGVLGFNYPE